MTFCDCKVLQNEFLLVNVWNTHSIFYKILELWPAPVTNYELVCSWKPSKAKENRTALLLVCWNSNLDGCWNEHFHKLLNQLTKISSKNISMQVNSKYITLSAFRSVQHFLDIIIYQVIRQYYMLSLKHKVARYVWIRFYKKFVNLGFAGPSKKIKLIGA